MNGDPIGMLGVDFALLLLLGFGQAWIERRFAGWSANPRQLASGLWFGLGAALSMMHGARLASGVLIDVRDVAVMAAGAFGGPLAGAVAAVIACAVRTALGGGIGPAMEIVAAAILGYGLARLRSPDRGFVWPATIGLLGAVTHIGLFMLIPHQAVPGGWWAAGFLTSTYVLGFPLVAVVVARERQRAGREQQLGAILDWTPLFIGLLDIEGRVLQANRVALQYVGVRETEVRGRYFWQTAWCTGDPEIGERFRNAVVEAAGGRVARFEAELAGTGGRCRTFEFVVDPIRDQAGRVGMLLAEGRDVSEQKEAEARLSETQDSLRQAQKMETVGQLTGGIAHDFNNILAIVSGNLELLRRHALPGETGRLIEAALRAVSRGATLTQHLLAFSRKQNLTPTVVSMNDIASDAAAMLRRILDESIEVRTELASDLRLGYFDPHQLETAILNLAINARDAMPQGGTLTISTGNACHDSALSEDAPAGDYLQFVVRDTGTGMTPEVLRRAFEPFFSTKPVGHGSGLGLSMVYGFIMQSGGHIELLSEPGHGTTVVIHLPVAPGFESDLPTGRLSETAV